MKKLLIVIVLFFALRMPASAAPVSAFPIPAPTIPEGAIVKTVDNPDVYIIKYNAGNRYKRLVLNPLVFQSYGHLKWENLLTIPCSQMDAFITSDLVRVDGATDVYQLFPEGDNGDKFLLTSPAGYDMDSVYTINAVDFGNYTLKENKILAIYELGDRVLYAAENPSTSSFYTWSLPQYKSERYLSYGVTFDSAEHGEILRSGMGYQIKLDNKDSPTFSDTYYFQGNRAVIDSPVCPYAQYINGECKFGARQDDVNSVGLAMLSPKGGEAWMTEGSYTIFWKAVGTDKVNLLLYKGNNCSTGIEPDIKVCGNAYGIAIAIGISNTGSYSWKIPADLPEGNDYRIAVQNNYSLPSIAQSKNAFSIYNFRGIVAMKPVLYLYPRTPQTVEVSLDFDGTLTTTYPAYGNGWNVFAYPDGKLIDLSDGKEYSYLFWEGAYDQEIDYDLSKGFVVAGKDTAAFLQDTLFRMGLTPKEYNEFIVYWLPRMQNNKYNLIHFADKKEYDDHARLSISSEPDSVLRVFMVYKPLEETQAIEPQAIKPFARTGFSAVEWGGAEIR